MVARVIESTRSHESGAWFLLGAAMSTTFIAIVALQLNRLAATAAEAQLAAATSPTDLGGTAPGWPLSIAARQLAAVVLLLDPSQSADLLDATRAAALVFTLVASLLIFPVTRRLVLSRASAAATVGLSAVLVGLLQLYGGVDAGAVALAWLTLAAVLALAMARTGRFIAVAAAAIGVLTVPLAAVALLVVGGHLVAASQLAPTLPAPRRRLVAGALWLGAALVAGLATGDRPLALPAPQGLPSLAAVLLVAAAGLVVVAAARRVVWLRPVCSGTGALLACALVPGTGLITVATLALPVVALLVIAIADTLTPPAPGGALVGAASLLGLLALAPAAAATLDSPGATSGQPLSGWVATELDPSRVLLVDDLTGAQLVRDGIPASRLRPATTPAPPPDAVTVLSQRRGDPATAAQPGSVLLARFGSGPGRAPIEVRLPGSPQLAAAVAADAADRARFGTALAGNPALRLTPEAAETLRTGGVDARLMTVLAALAAAHHLTVSGFAPVEAEPAQAPRRTAVVTTFDDVSTSDAGTAQVLGAWLARQLPPYTPTVTQQPGYPLQIRFPGPSPLGLLAG